jgi:hypothetical protein
MFAPSLNLDLDKLRDSDDKGKKKAEAKAEKSTKADEAKGSDD